MPDFNTAKRLYNTKNRSTIGQMLKDKSDWAIEQSWDNDIQSKSCYIYDWFHDDQPNIKSGMSYENTTKTPIDVKFIVSTYSSLSKDQNEYHIMFKPSQKVRDFVPTDDLYYFESDYHEKYGDSYEFPIGCFIDIPDEKGVYEKWFICQKEDGNQFIKYIVLKVNYYLDWIEWDNGKRIKRHMWCVRRSQNSYNSGLWTDRYITRIQNQAKLWLPLNSITEKMGYTWRADGSIVNQRVIVSAKTSRPTAWKISRVENAQPVGVQKLTIYEDQFDPNLDKIVYDDDGHILHMYADYNLSSVEPLNDTDNNDGIHLIVNSTSTYLKIGGSYKTISAAVFNGDTDVTSEYLESFNENSWSFYIDDEQIGSDIISVVFDNNLNNLKIKFIGDISYITKILTVRCDISESIHGEISFELISL